LIIKSKYWPFFFFLISFTLRSNSLYTQTINSKIDSLIHDAYNIGSSNHLKAKNLADSALSLSKQYSYLKGEAEALRIKGLSLFYGVQYSEALDFFLKSYNLYKSLSDSVGMAKANNNIAILYSYQGLNNRSLEIHIENLAFCEKIDYNDGISTSLNNIAVTLIDLNREEEALDYYRRAIKMVERTNDLRPLSRYYNNLGTLFLNLQQKDSAIHYLKTGLKIRLDINERQGIKNSYESIGLYYKSTGDLMQAKEYLEKSLEIANEIGIVYEIESTAKELSNIYANLGLYQKAYDAHKLYMQMSDSLKRNETAQLLTRIDLEAAFEKERNIQRLIQEKKDIENQLIINKQKQFKNVLLLITIALIIIALILYRGFLIKKKNNQTLERQKEEIIEKKEEILAHRNEIEEQKIRLQELNSTKDKFFSILAHDLKSPITGMVGLSKIIDDQIKQSDNEELQLQMDLLHQSINQTYALLDNLLTWSQTQTGKIKFNPQSFQLNDLVRSNIELFKLKCSEKNISIKFVSNSLNIAFADMDMLNTVIRNLISNAIKFTHENGEIEIYTTETPNQNNSILEKPSIMLSINDNGIGINYEKLKKLFTIDQTVSSLGTNKEKGTGLGLAICKEFIEINGGKIWAESIEGKGSSFYFSIPQH